MTAEASGPVADGATPATSERGQPPLTLTALQCELRSLFVGRPVHRALAMALGRVGATLRAEYAVLHARAGVQPISEEWSRDESVADEIPRESVNAAMLETIAAGSARWFGLREHGRVLLVATLHDDDLQPAGGLAVLLPNCPSERAGRLLSLFEGVAGFLALLVHAESSSAAVQSKGAQSDLGSAASHPVRLAMTMASEVKNRFGFDLAAVGYAQGRRVRVEAVSGLDELRASDPGVRSIRGAMEECLDRGEPLCHGGRQNGVGGEQEDDCRLHAQWIGTLLGGGAVGSVPVTVGDEIVAVLAVTSENAGTVTRERLLRAADAVAMHAALVPVTRSAARGLVRHGLDVVLGGARGALGAAGRGRRRSLIVTMLALALVALVVFGRAPYRITVPCVVRPAALRTIACPRDGMLAELFVRPGDPVQAGQLLAALDAHQDVLRQAELDAEVRSLETLADAALAQRDAGQLRVHQARIESLRAQLAVVENSIALAQIRATQPGIVMEGDLRELVGSRLSMGDVLFKIARYDRMKVVLEIPENVVLDAREAEAAVFASAARPDREFVLSELRVAPSGTVAGGRNVFLGEALADATLDGLAPGMEGVAQLDVGSRSVVWVLTHRLVDWLRLNFWV